MDQINWDAILWVGGVFLAIITGLLAWIAKLIQSDREEIGFRLDKHDKKFRKQQKQIYTLTLNTNDTLGIIKHKLNIK